MRLLILLILLPFITQGQIVRTHPYYKPFAASGCTPDADAQKFIDSTGITDQTQKDAICTLVRELKDSSLWSLITVFYPIIGSTSSTQKWNLKNPSQYNLTFYGGWTHTVNGAKANGTNAYATTDLQYSDLTSGDFSMFDYIGDSSTTVNSGAWSTFQAASSSIYNVRGGSTYSTIAYHFSSPITIPSVGSVLGFYSINVNSTTTSLYKNGTSLNSYVTAGSFPSANPIEVARNPAYGGIEYKTDQYRALVISKSLTAGQQSALNIIVEKFNDALGRGVQ